MTAVGENVRRMLRHYALAEAVWLTAELEDRVFGWPNGHDLLAFVIAERWNPDGRHAAALHHGTQFSYREPGGVRPALQCCFHAVASAGATEARQGRYFVELDFDYASPAGGWWSFVIHAGEVLTNVLTGAKTDQGRIARGLDRRGIAR